MKRLVTLVLAVFLAGCAGQEALAKKVALEPGAIVRIDSVRRFMEEAFAAQGREVSPPRARFDLVNGRVDLDFEAR